VDGATVKFEDLHALCLKVLRSLLIVVKRVSNGEVGKVGKVEVEGDEERPCRATWHTCCVGATPPPLTAVPEAGDSPSGDGSSGEICFLFRYHQGGQY